MFVKKAMRRTHDLPVGCNGGLHLECECGRQVPMYDTRGQRIEPDRDGNPPRCACGILYDYDGWIIERARAES